MILSAQAGTNPLGHPEVKLELTQPGAGVLARITEQNIDQHLAFLFDGKPIAVPKVMGKIASGNLSLPAPSPAQAQALARAIEAAARQTRTP
jgi:preprotein translocase subunit SecD